MVREWYPTLARFVNAAFPGLRKTRERDLTLLTWAILKRRWSMCKGAIPLRACSIGMRWDETGNAAV